MAKMTPLRSAQTPNIQKKGFLEHPRRGVPMGGWGCGGVPLGGAWCVPPSHLLHYRSLNWGEFIAKPLL